MSPAPHAVDATPVVGHAAQLCPQARSVLPQVKAWHARLVGPVVGQRVPLAQAPQLATERVAPQRSVTVSAPQVVLDAAQSSASVCGVQPHWLAVPPPPQVFGLAHPPQLETLRELPQVSVPESAPHTAPRRAQNCVLVSAGHEQARFRHWLTPLQVPHDASERGTPQLSVPLSAPQLAP